MLPDEKVVAILQVGYPEMIPNLRERTPIAEMASIFAIYRELTSSQRKTGMSLNANGYI